MMPSRMLSTLFAVLLVAPWPAAADQTARPGAEARATAAIGAPVNINTADVKALMTLDGVGRRVAEKIVEYRQKNGPFAKPEDVRRVSGIGKGLWERNRERIVVK